MSDNGRSGNAQNDGRNAVGRRDCLRLGAAAVAGLGGLGTVGGASAASADISFENVYNAVEDLGADPGGSDPIDGLLEEYAESGNLIEFPPGEYLVEGRTGVPDVSNFGIRGIGGSREDVQFVFPDGHEGVFLAVRKGRNWLFENFTIQQSDDRETSASLVLYPNDNLVLRNVKVAGYSPADARFALATGVFDAGGSALIEDYAFRGGGFVGDYPAGQKALLADRSHEGTLTMRGLDIREAGENGVYASRGSGAVRIEGSYFENNDIASVRIAGEGSYVKDSTFVVDTENTGNVDGTFDSTRGLWFENGGTGLQGGLVEDCEFVMRSSDNSAGLINVGDGIGDVTVRNCRFHNETGWGTVLADSDGGPVTVEGVSITGSTSDERRAGIEFDGRSGSTVTDSCIQLGGDRNGIVLRDGSYTVTNSTINVEAEPIVTENASVDESGISTSGSCPVPSRVDGDSVSVSSDDGTEEGTTSEEEETTTSEEEETTTSEEEETTTSEEEETTSGDDDDGERVSEQDGPGPVGDFESAPTDPDGDGVYEDVNGDGEATVSDAQSFYRNVDGETVESNPEAFDFNGDGETDIVDVQALFDELE